MVFRTKNRHTILNIGTPKIDITALFNRGKIMSEQNVSKQIYSLIPKIMSDVGAIAKARKNAQQGYAFRGIDDVYNALQEPLTKHGVFFVPEVLKHERSERQTKTGGVLIYTIIDMKFTFFGPDGSSIAATTTGEAMDSGDKSCNKAMSAALKYALFDVFCIATEESKDSEDDTHTPAPIRPAANQKAKPANTNTYLNTFIELLDAALTEREFGVATAYTTNQINAMIKKKYKIDLDAITKDIGEKIISAVKSGSFDKLKEEYEKSKTAKKK